jgi:hypothetical protein
MRGYRPLQMHARQNLGEPISVDSCRSINVVLHNADTQPDAVRMELILIDSSRHARNSQTLGEQSLASPTVSVPDREFGCPSESFRFEMPQHSEIQSFDSLDVWFHLKPPRMTQSGSVSMQRFELIP